jgi:hypothetical protein
LTQIKSARGGRSHTTVYVRFAPKATVADQNVIRRFCAKNCREQVQQHSRAEGNLLDHLVGPRQQRDRRIEAERLGSFQVDDELKFVRKLGRQVAGLGAFENAIDVGCRAAARAP